VLELPLLTGFVCRASLLGSVGCRSANMLDLLGSASPFCDVCGGLKLRSGGKSRLLCGRWPLGDPGSGPSQP